MKLYTEEQVKMLFRKKTLIREVTIESMCQDLKSIELPSDEEIIKVALEYTPNINMQIAFNNGAIYICKLIQGNFNLQIK